MIIRVTFFILMSLGLIGFGTVAWVTTRPLTAAAPVANTKPVLVAGPAIQGGSLLMSEDLQVKEMPVEFRRKMVDLIEAGKLDAEVAERLEGDGDGVLGRPTEARTDLLQPAA